MTRISLTRSPHILEDIQRSFTKAVVILINTNMEDIWNCLEIGLERGLEPEGMSNDFRADIVRVIPGKISDICVGPFHISTPRMIHTGP